MANDETILEIRDGEVANASYAMATPVNFSVKRGERVAIIGANGTGKTTILKILNGLVEPDAG